MAGLKQIWTIGYERVGQADFVAALKEAAGEELRLVSERLKALGGHWFRMANQMVKVVGSDMDDFSLATGRWRYLRW